MKKNNIDKEKLKENLKNPRTRALMFFGFYFVFFAVLFVMINIGSDDNRALTEENTGVDISYQFERINQKNYHFNYQIIENNNTIIFDGDKNLTKEQFVVTKGEEKKEYFNSDNIFLLKNDTWELSESPYLYETFLDSGEINRLLKNSTFISKTEYSNKEMVYQYQISTTTLLSLIDKQEVDLMDEVNKINLSVKDNEVYKIELDLTPYFMYKGENINNLSITLEYTKFGEIKDLVTPNY